MVCRILKMLVRCHGENYFLSWLLVYCEMVPFFNFNEILLLKSHSHLPKFDETWLRKLLNHWSITTAKWLPQLNTCTCMNNLLNTLIWYFFTDILNNLLCILSVPILIQLSLDAMYEWEKISFLHQQAKYCPWFANGTVMTFSLEDTALSWNFQRGAFFSEKFKTFLSERKRMMKEYFLFILSCCLGKIDMVSMLFPNPMWLQNLGNGTESCNPFAPGAAST